MGDRAELCRLIADIVLDISKALFVGESVDIFIGAQSLWSNKKGAEHSLEVSEE